MTIRESEIYAIDPETYAWITVRYTTEIQTFDDLSGVTRQFESPYVLTAVANHESKTLIYFADARMHKEFEKALRTDPETRNVQKWWYGQLAYIPEMNRFSGFNINELPGNNPQQVLKNLKTFFDRINPELLDDIVRIGTGVSFGGLTHIYYPLARRFKTFTD